MYRKNIFKSMMPVLGDRQINQDFSILSIDTNTYDGQLTNFACPKSVCLSPSPAVKIFPECCETWDSHVTKTEDCGLFFMTGQGAPKILDSLCDGAEGGFYIPCADPPLPLGGGQGRVVSYFITTEIRQGTIAYHSKPSQPCEEIRMGVDGVFLELPSGKHNLYRIDSVTNTGSSKTSTEPVILLIAENCQTNFTDRDETGSVVDLDIFDMREMPETCFWSGRLDDGVMVAIDSEYLYHTKVANSFTWIGQYEIPKRLGKAIWAVSRETDVIVFTEKDVLIYSLRLNEVMPTFERRAMNSDAPLTSIAGVSDFKGGVIYPSQRGLMMIVGVPYGRNAIPDITVIPIMPYDDWKKINHKKINGCCLDGFYLFNDGSTGYLISFNDGMSAASELQSVTQIYLDDLFPEATAVTSWDGKFYWSFGNIMYSWSPYPASDETKLCPFEYHLAPFSGEYYAAEVFMKSDSDVEIQVSHSRNCTDDSRIFVKRKVPCRDFRMPTCSRSRENYVVLKGYGIIEEIRFASSSAELNMGSQNAEQQ